MQKKIVLAISALAAVLSFSVLLATDQNSSISKEVANLFQHWKLQQGKQYNSPEELIYRLRIFSKNLGFISATN